MRVATESSRPARKASVDVVQDGVTATVRAVHVCGDRKTQRVEIATTRDRLNESATLDWGLAVTGVAAAGVGAGLMVDSVPTTYLSA
jgi:hypothetical protein